MVATEEVVPAVVDTVVTVSKNNYISVLNARVDSVKVSKANHCI